MHAQLGDDVFAVVVEVVVALGEGAAVGTEVRPDCPHRPIDIGDKRPLGRGVSEDMATTIIGSEP